MGRPRKNKEVVSQPVETETAVLEVSLPEVTKPIEEIKPERVRSHIPPKIFKRNEYGLLIDDVGYLFNEDGTVDWRSMVDTKYLVPNQEKTAEKDISKLADDQLIILLAGLKKLAQIRGYKEVSFKPIIATPDYVSLVCQIQWTANFETENREVLFEACADAGIKNTNGLGQLYLTAIAENRAFARCVRNFLQINIVSKEEVGAVYVPQNLSTNPEAWVTLQEKMHSKNIFFAQVIKILEEEKYEKLDKIRTIEDIPASKCFELIGKINALP